MKKLHNKSDTKNSNPDEFYQTIFIRVGDGIFLSDKQGRMLEANPRGCEISGCQGRGYTGQAAQAPTQSMYNKKVHPNPYLLVEDKDIREPFSKGKLSFAFWSWVLIAQKELVREKAT